MSYTIVPLPNHTLLILRLSSIPLAAIVGGAVGGGLFIIFILFVGWRYRLNRRRRTPRVFPNLPPPQLVDLDLNRNKYDKAELENTSTTNRLSKNPSVGKPTPTLSVVSPVSPTDEKTSPLLAGRTEMEAQNRSELHPEHASYEIQGGPHAHELTVNVPRQEVQGSTQYPVEVPATSANMNEGPVFELGPYR